MTLAATFRFELVSPERVLLQANAEQVTLSGSEGDFTVLPGHAPVVATLLPGIVHATMADGKKAIYVRGGFAEVTPDSLSVLVESAFITDQADREMVERELAAAQAALDAADDNEARFRHTRALEALRALTKA